MGGFLQSILEAYIQVELEHRFLALVKDLTPEQISQHILFNLSLWAGLPESEREEWKNKAGPYTDRLHMLNYENISKALARGRLDLWRTIVIIPNGIAWLTSSLAEIRHDLGAPD